MLLSKAMLQVLENQGVTFGDHVKKVAKKISDFQIYDKKTHRFVNANQFRTDIPLSNYEGYVRNCN